MPGLELDTRLAMNLQMWAFSRKVPVTRLRRFDRMKNCFYTSGLEFPVRRHEEPPRCLRVAAVSRVSSSPGSAA